jgi:uncharacterized protein YegP (UPF0339 family)
MGKFQVKKAGKGQQFNLLSTNGQVIATSQVYASPKSLKGGIASVQANAPVAEIEDQTVAGAAKIANPKFELYTDKAGKTRFRLKAKNGQVIAASEAYETKRSALAGIASVRKNAPGAQIVEA